MGGGRRNCVREGQAQDIARSLQVVNGKIGGLVFGIEE